MLGRCVNPGSQAEWLMTSFTVTGWFRIANHNHHDEVKDTRLAGFNSGGSKGGLEDRVDESNKRAWNAAAKRHRLWRTLSEHQFPPRMKWAGQRPKSQAAAIAAWDIDWSRERRSRRPAVFPPSSSNDGRRHDGSIRVQESEWQPTATGQRMAPASEARSNWLLACAWQKQQERGYTKGRAGIPDMRSILRDCPG